MFPKVSRQGLTARRSRNREGLTMRAEQSRRSPRCLRRGRPFGAGAAPNPMKDHDPRIAINSLVDAGETLRSSDFGLGGFLDDAERVRLEPAALDERGERRTGETMSIGRVEKGERKWAAGGRGTEPRRRRRARCASPRRAPAPRRWRAEPRAPRRRCRRRARNARRATAPRRPRPPIRRTGQPRARPRFGRGIGVRECRRSTRAGAPKSDGWRATTAPRERGP